MLQKIRYLIETSVHYDDELYVLNQTSAFTAIGAAVYFLFEGSPAVVTPHNWHSGGWMVLNEELSFPTL